MNWFHFSSLSKTKLEVMSVSFDSKMIYLTSEHDLNMCFLKTRNLLYFAEHIKQN